MRQSSFFSRTLRNHPKDAVTISHRYLVRAGYINQLTSGVWSLLPLAWRVYKKIENIIRQEMNVIGGQEIFLPTLQPKELWQRTGRWETIDPPLFKTKDRHNKWLGLGSTHEEVITDLVRQHINSYRDLPLALYQIQNKFRNEMRPTGGLLRTREFIMKDLYSFHINEEDLNNFYQKVLQVYHNIYERFDLKAIAVEASSGSIGGSESYEFMILADSGEDRILVCSKCQWGVNIEMSIYRQPKAGPPRAENIEQCPKCGGKLEQKNAIEASHAFKLGTLYSKKLGANFRDKDGREKPIIMGCYGIGLQRLMAAVVEVHHDKNGIIWPKSVAPFGVHLISLDSDNKEIVKLAESYYQEFQSEGIEVLYDDRQESAGIKLKDADLIGIPVRLVVSRKTKNKIEYKERSKKKIELLTLKELFNKL